jgi:hypothetical protein
VGFSFLIANGNCIIHRQRNLLLTGHTAKK